LPTTKKKLKKDRDNQARRNAISALREQAEKMNVNLLPAIIEATKASSTLGEIMGTIREAYGHHYDPLKIIESPFIEMS